VSGEASATSTPRRAAARHSFTNHSPLRARSVTSSTSDPVAYPSRLSCSADGSSLKRTTWPQASRKLSQSRHSYLRSPGRGYRRGPAVSTGMPPKLCAPHEHSANADCHTIHTKRQRRTTSGTLLSRGAWQPTMAPPVDVVHVIDDLELREVEAEGRFFAQKARVLEHACALQHREPITELPVQVPTHVLQVDLNTQGAKEREKKNQHTGHKAERNEAVRERGRRIVYPYTSLPQQNTLSAR